MSRRSAARIHRQAAQQLWRRVWRSGAARLNGIKAAWLRVNLIRGAVHQLFTARFDDEDGDRGRLGW
jgi:hypothetical protein